jgi:hypothetical protein
MSKYTGEKLDYVIELLEQDNTLSITAAVKKMCEKFDIGYSDTIRININRSLIRRGKGKKDLENSDSFKQAQNKTFDKRKKTFIITWAQNATPIHQGLWDNIQAYAKDLNANLHVIAGRYKNPTSVFVEEKHDYWDAKVRPYLDANRHNIHQYLQVLSDVKISPTAATPLSGLNSITGLESCVVGHPRQHLKSLPVLEGYPHKLLLSTGACTVPNYTDSKAGKKGEFHHMLGFVIVELDGDFFHIRQVNCDDDGNFYDVYKRVKEGVVYNNEEGIDAAILGDVHVRHNDPVATAAAFNFIKKTEPEHIVVHDVSEMESILHWDEKDPFKLLKKEEEGLDNLEEEIEGVMDWIRKHKDYGQLVVARSNHDDMLDRWLKNTDWRKAKNKKIYLKLSNILANNESAQIKGVLPFLIDQQFGEEVITLSLDDSFRIHDWELAMHGHLGANGSRGGHTQFKNLNTKNAVGHGHHPHREDGHIMVGTLSYLRVGFNRGPSNWMNGFGVIYPDGKFQILHIIKGKICR